MSYQLPREKRLAVLAGLVDGNSESAVERMTDAIGLGVTQKTIGLFALKLGTAAQSLHNMQAHDLSVSLLELDEIWSYVKKKQARVNDAEHAAGLGEAYSFVALGMPSRYVVTWKVGKRDQVTTDAFVSDLRSRLVVMPAMMTSDGFAPYVSAIAASFGRSADYAQYIKTYTRSGRRDDDHRYEPPRDPFVTKKAIFGAPDLDTATTAHIERNNGTMRHFIGRMRRLVYAFSKKPENHRAAVALGYVHYNLCHCLKTKGMTKITPAMAAGVTKHPWELGELLDALLSVPETVAPVTVPLAPRKPATPSRELPGGRGFLRIVPKGDSPQAPPPAPMPAPGAPAAAVGAVGGPVARPARVEPATPAPAAPQAPPVDDRQLDLLSWKPKAPPTPKRIEATPEQLSLLFGIDLDPGPKK